MRKCRKELGYVEHQNQFIVAKMSVTRRSKDSAPPERGDELGPLVASYDH